MRKTAGVRAAMVEMLEGRVLLAATYPTPQEQEMLELVNRMRTNPGPELNLLLKAGNRDVQAALDDFHVNITNLKAQWSQLKAVPPVAWNVSLYRAARGHSQAMIDADEQSHQVKGEASLRDRVDAQGYNPQSYLGENVYAYAASVFHAHAAFAIDWGPSPSGIQQPPGHRQNMMDIDPEIPYGHREVGIGILKAPKGARETGPLVVSQEFGAPLSPGKAYLLGTVRAEIKRDGRYNAGEGLGGVKIVISNGTSTSTTTTWGAGGYQLRLAPGTYTVTARGGGLAYPLKRQVVVGSDNVKVDFIAPPEKVAPRAKLGSVAAAGSSLRTVTVNYTDNLGVLGSSLGKGDIEITNGKGFRQVVSLMSRSPLEYNARAIRAVYKLVAPGGSWDAQDNGVYTVRLVGGQVKDLLGNAAAAGVLGRFTVSV